jgi:hypothetical protein
MTSKKELKEMVINSHLEEISRPYVAFDFFHQCKIDTNNKDPAIFYLPLFI